MHWVFFIFVDNATMQISINFVFTWKPLIHRLWLYGSSVPAYKQISPLPFCPFMCSHAIKEVAPYISSQTDFLDSITRLRSTHRPWITNPSKQKEYIRKVFQDQLREAIREVRSCGIHEKLTAWSPVICFPCLSHAGFKFPWQYSSNMAIERLEHVSVQ